MGGLNKLEEKEKSMEYNFDSDVKENDIYKNCKKDTYTIYSTISKNGISIEGDSIISYWNDNLNFSNNNFVTLESMFYNCELLLSIPDISKWNTNNNYIFE